MDQAEKTTGVNRQGTSESREMGEQTQQPALGTVAVPFFLLQCSSSWCTLHPASLASLNSRGTDHYLPKLATRWDFETVDSSSEFPQASLWPAAFQVHFLSLSFEIPTHHGFYKMSPYSYSQHPQASQPLTSAEGLRHASREIAIPSE